MSLRVIDEIPKILTSSGDLEKVIKDSLSNRYLSIDIEGNGFFRYPEFVCLIQLCVGEDIYLVDPLAIDDISALGKVFANDKIV